jgi:hypothetical protein
MLLKGDPQSADIRTGRLTVATATQLAGGWSSHCSYCGRFITADGCPKGCSTAKDLSVTSIGLASGPALP